MTSADGFDLLRACSLFCLYYILTTISKSVRGALVCAVCLTRGTGHRSRGWGVSAHQNRGGRGSNGVRATDSIDRASAGLRLDLAEFITISVQLANLFLRF